MRVRYGTRQRLFIAFALLVSTFALASYLTLARIEAVQRDLLQEKRYEEGVRASLELATAVRDQYAHQANTIIVGDDSHLAPYELARRRVREGVEQVRSYATAPDECMWVRDVATASVELDRVFRERLVPAVLEHASGDVQREHARAQELVTLIQERSDRLVDRFQSSIERFRGDVAALQREAMRWTAVFVIAAPLLAILVALFVYRSVARPVSLLQAGALRVAQGDLDARIRIDSPDELGALARQFNAMTRALKDHQERLVEHEKLAGIGRMAAGVAHEINNPLAVILGYARLLRRKAVGEAAADLQIIEDESLRAKAIVDGLLDLTRSTQTEHVRVDLRALGNEVIERLTGSKALEGVTASVTGEGAVVGSPQELRQVVLNLVKNAAEAAAPHGHVDIEIASDQDVVRIVVRDTGAGLSAGALQRVFEPFFTGKSTGTGLGLAVSNGIVRAHGGTIEVSNIPSGGARFEVRLPRGAPLPEEPRRRS